MPLPRQQIIGYDKRNRPIWQVMGAAESGSGDSGKGAGQGGDSGGDAGKAGTGDNSGATRADGVAADLGDAGKRALAAERERAKTAETKLAELQKQVDEQEDAKRTEGEKALRRAEKAEGSLTAVTAERDAVRSQVENIGIVLRTALGDEVANRLIKASDRLLGATPEERATDAADLLAGFTVGNNRGGQPPAPRPDLSQGKQRTGGASEDVRPGTDRMRNYFAEQDRRRTSA